MRFGTAAGLGLALGSTVALNWGFFAQHGAAVSLPRLELRRPLRSLSLLFRTRRWLTGFGVGLSGWAAYVGALALAPLSLVQAVSAGGIGVLALLVHLGPTAPPLRQRDMVAVVLALTGLALLGASLGGGEVSGTASTFAVGLVVGVAVAAACGVAAVGRNGAALGAAAGGLYAAGDVATKAAVGGAALAFIPIVFAAHGLAFVALQLGFQRGTALVTIGLSTMLTNALPIAAGAVLFHERLPAGPLGDCRVAAFALVTVSATMLARG